MQAAQNTAQVFLGVNLKCNACHDSFVSRWKLKDAYALAAYFSPEPTLSYTAAMSPRTSSRSRHFLFPELSHQPKTMALADWRAAAAATFIVA